MADAIKKMVMTNVAWSWYNGLSLAGQRPRGFMSLSFATEIAENIAGIKDIAEYQMTLEDLQFLVRLDPAGKTKCVCCGQSFAPIIFPVRSGRFFEALATAGGDLRKVEIVGGSYLMDMTGLKELPLCGSLQYFGLEPDGTPYVIANRRTCLGIAFEDPKNSNPKTSEPFMPRTKAECDRILGTIRAERQRIAENAHQLEEKRKHVGNIWTGGNHVQVGGTDKSKNSINLPPVSRRQKNAYPRERVA